MINTGGAGRSGLVRLSPAESNLVKPFNANPNDQDYELAGED